MKKYFSLIFVIVYCCNGVSQNTSLKYPLTLERCLAVLHQRNPDLIIANQYIDLAVNNLEIFESSNGSQHAVNIRLFDNYGFTQDRHNSVTDIYYNYSRQLSSGISINLRSSVRTGNMMADNLSGTPIYPNYMINATYYLNSNELPLNRRLFQSHIVNTENTQNMVLLQKNYEVIFNYISLYFHLEKLEKLKYILKLTNKIYSISKERFERDVIDLESLLNSQINLNEIRLRIIQTESIISRNLSELSILSSVFITNLYREYRQNSCTFSFLKKKFEGLRPHEFNIDFNLASLSSHPEIQQINIQKKINEINIELIEKRYSPQLSFNLNLSGNGILNSNSREIFAFDNFNHNIGFYVNYSIPIFDTGLKRNRVEEYYIWNNLNENKYIKIKNLKTENIKRHFQNLEEIKIQVEVYDSLIHIEDIRLGILTEEFERNEIDLDYFLRKQQSYVQKIDRFIDLIMDYFFSVNNLYYDSGDERILKDILFRYF